jgi:restriction system protein
MGSFMAIPDFQSLMLPVLTLAAGGEMLASDAVQRLADQFQLTEAERTEPMPSGRGSQTLFNNRVHWAITYLAHAGLIVRPRRAYFSLTERGKAILARNLRRVDNQVLSEFQEFNEWKLRGTGSRERGKAAVLSSVDAITRENTFETSETPLERIDADYQRLTSEVREELLTRILAASPAFFEILIVDLLVAMGYGGTRKDAAKAIGRSGDEGIDGIIKEDPLGLDVVYLQAKRYQPGNSVGRPAVQSFAGSLDGFSATKGVFVTTSAFSKDAKEYADRISKRVILIDGDDLTKLLLQYSVGVRTSAVYEVKRVDEDYFE